jgi:GT2 family glycosyltransferase
VIIATRDRGDLLRCCITSLAEHAQGNPPTELIVIDNDSSEPETLHYLAHLEQQENVRVLRRPGKFNYAALNNEAVALARGELVALMNNDVEATHPSWLAAMAGQALRPEIGAVGAKLLFPDGTIQHAGVLLGIGGIAGHAHKYLAAEEEGYQLRLHLAHNLSAVTAATLVVRKALFEAVGGFDAINFAVNYNDVDFCLRLIKAGYRNLYCPDAVLIHHESKSRGAPTEADTYAQWQRERQAMVDRWGAALEADPYYSPHLSLLEENLSLTLKSSTTTARTSALPPS